MALWRAEMWTAASVFAAMLSTPAWAMMDAGQHDASTPPPVAAPAPVPRTPLHLSATLTPDGPVVKSGVIWRIYNEKAEPDGSHRLVGQSTDPDIIVSLPDGLYVVHATYGFASAMRTVAVAGRPSAERLTLNAGGMEVAGVMGDAPIPSGKLSLSVFVPDHGNAEAKLVVAGAKPGQIIRLPEGMYHLVSTYLDTVGVGSLTPVSDTNSVISADLHVQAGKLVKATVTHRAAVLTLKLVNATGGEALANTSFTILTQGGDIIRELIGAFPSLVLAEGEYLLIARHDGKTYQTDFKVQAALDRDIEVLAH